MVGGTGFEPATPSLEATLPSLHKLFGANLCFTELERDLEVFHDFLGVLYTPYEKTKDPNEKRASLSGVMSTSFSPGPQKNVAPFVFLE